MLLDYIFRIFLGSIAGYWRVASVRARGVWRAFDLGAYFLWQLVAVQLLWSLKPSQIGLMRLLHQRFRLRVLLSTHWLRIVEVCPR